MSYSVDQLLANAASITGLTDEAGSEDRAQLDQFVNDGIMEIFKKTACVVERIAVTLTAGVDEYSMDNGVLKILNYAQSTSAPSVKITPMDARDIIERKFLQSTGTVRYYSVLGSNLLIVSPTPDTAQVIYFYAVPTPQAVATSTDVFSTNLPLYAKRALEAYVNARGLEANHDYQAARFRGAQIIYGSAAYWWGQFDEEIGTILVTQRQQAGRTLPRGAIGYPDSWHIGTPGRNDTYSSDDPGF